MAGKGEKSCPICTEEMDLTDQQLKPCKCGYEICVWCWHHIMEMAQKDETEGRCPACRSPYDKDRIVAMASNCQRLVAEMNSQHKKKMQKLNLKPKSLDGRKHLCDVRVIQRNLVYIIGLPLNLADEELLQRRDYFGRYGKVLKVSISRTANGIIQHSANNSCCVYITYSKESEAVRCIQSVHCFVLEGRPLRACFGTTKYCHAWLRNVPCSNRDCLYLHDHGSHEDSFTKDELVLAFARSRVQQIIGATNNLHRRSGNVLPPPVDDPKLVSSATKLMSKSSLDKCENQIKGSASDIGAVNSSALPAVNSWVRCVSGSLSQDTSSCPGDLANQKVEASNDPQALVSRVACTESSILNTRRLEEAENGSAVHLNGSFVPSEMNKHDIGGNSQTRESNVFSEVTVEKLTGNVLSSYETPLAAFIGNDQDIVAPSVSTSFLELPQHDLNIDTSVGINSNGDVHGLCSGLSSININNHLEDSYFTPDADGLPLTHNSINSSIGQHLQQGNGHSTEHSTIPAFWEDIIVDDILLRDYEQQKISKGINYLSSGLHSSCLPQNVNQSSHQPLQQDQIYHQNHLGKTSESFNGHSQTGFVKHVESKDNGTGIDSMIASDMGENNIISNILSLELDAWEGSLDKLLGESDELYKPFKAPTLRKVQDKNQSRFSFARQDDFKNEASNLQQSFEATKLDPERNFSSGGLVGNKDTHTGRYPHVFPSGNSILSDKFVGSQFYVPSNVSMSKAHTSSPPGFSLSSRIPPGFSYGRVEQDCNSSVKHLQPQYVSPSGNTDRIGDEFNNLAVLDFGKGTMAERMNNASFDMRQTSFPQFSPREDDPRLKLLMQQSTPTQNLRVPDHVGNRFFPQIDAYRVSSRFLDQFQSNSPSIYEQIHSQEFSSNTLASNNQWGGWNDAKNFSGLSKSEVLNNERVGFSNFMPSYDKY